MLITQNKTYIFKNLIYTLSLLLITMLIFGNTAISQGSSSIGISPSSGSFAVGSIIDVGVDINATEPVASGQVHVLYDQTKLKFVDLVSTNNPFVNDMGSSLNPGDIKIARSTDGEGVSGTVQLIFKFETLASGPVTVSIGPETALFREMDMEDVWNGVRPSAQYTLTQPQQTSPSSSSNAQTTNSSPANTGQSPESDSTSAEDSLSLVEESTEGTDNEEVQATASSESSSSGGKNNTSILPVVAISLAVLLLLGAVALISYILVKKKKVSKIPLTEADVVSTAVTASTNMVDNSQVTTPNDNNTTPDNSSNQQGQVFTPTVIMPTVQKTDTEPPK